MEAEVAARIRRQSVDGPRGVPDYHGIFDLGKGLLRASGMMGRGVRNASEIGLSRIELTLPSLPRAFDGYRILHLTDLHVGFVPRLLERAAELVRGVALDLVVMTGDYQTFGKPLPSKAAAELEAIITAAAPVDGNVAVLGNHDTADMASALEAIGVQVLINRSTSITRGSATLSIVGLDDVNTFFHPSALQALRSVTDGFRMALVHSADVAGFAANAGYGLYLCGHTHGGQICLPGGLPIFTSLDRHRSFAKGVWHLGGLTGITSHGLGVHTTPPVRFNCPPEFTVVTIRSGG
jgi:predicted MPP superfamily phosphohydrolase